MGNTVQILSSITNSEEKSQEKEQEGGSKYTCEICIEPMSSNLKFKNSNKCAHHFCMDCMAKYIHVKVEEDVAADIECPGLNCKELLDPISCMPLIAHELFNKWCDNLCDSALLRFDKCPCPYQDCAALVVNECGGTLKQSKCPNCKRMFCFRCKIPWHAGHKCEESGQVVERKKWIRCPGCSNYVENIGGCRIILCRCHMKLCCNCGKMYYHGHECGKEDSLFVLILLGIAWLAEVVLVIVYAQK